MNKVKSGPSRGEARPQKGKGVAARTRRRQAVQPPEPMARHDSASGDPNFMTSLARGIAVIRAFSDQGQKLTISQISEKTGISRAAVRRCLYTLAQLGYVALDGRTFLLRSTILTLGHAYLSSTPLAALAQPVLDRISSALQESSSLAILDRGEIVYIARSATTRRIMSIDLKVGSRLPAYCTSMGRVLLAGLPPSELETYFARAQLKAHTDRTVTSPDKLISILAAVRSKGYAIVDQELEIALRSIAVPVRDSTGRVVAAINVGTHAARVSVLKMKTQFLPHLVAAARELGAPSLPRWEK